MFRPGLKIILQFSCINLGGVSFVLKDKMFQPSHDGGRYHIETSPLTGFYMMTVSVMKELKEAELTRAELIFLLLTHHVASKIQRQ